MGRNNYVKVYRGVHRVALPEANNPERYDWGGLKEGQAEQVLLDGVGIHWTPKFDTASKFAKEAGFNSWYDVDKSHTQGLVLEGYVHKRHLIDRRTNEGKYFSEKYDIWPGNTGESEKTIRPGAPIIITRMHNVGQQFVNSLAFEKEYPWRARA